MENLDFLTSIIRRHAVVRRVGRIKTMSSASVEVTGLSDVASIGHRVSFGPTGNLTGEVVGVEPDSITVLADSDLTTLRIGEPVRHIGQTELYPSKVWLGRLVDGDGSPLDGGPLVHGNMPVKLDARPPAAVSRRGLGARIPTGYALFNTIIPLARGQRIGLFSGSGVGKSSLMAAFARDLEADVVVIALIGERGREVNHFVHNVLGQRGLKRSVIVAATSDKSALSRRKAAATAMAIAEFFRDQGLHVLLMLDSVTRLAEAHREIAAASGEPMTMRGFPPSMVGLLAGFTERAGPGNAEQGDITAVFTVLVSGSDMEEPVADTMRGLLDGHIVLSRETAERGRFPAVNILQSVSRSLPDVASDRENALIARARSALSLYEESELMVRSGLYQSGSNPSLDRAIELFPELDAFAARREASVTVSFELLSKILDEHEVQAE